MRRNQIRRQKQESEWVRLVLNAAGTEALAGESTLGITHPVDGVYPTEDQTHPLKLFVPSAPYPATVHLLPVRIVSVGVGSTPTQSVVGVTSTTVMAISWRWLQPLTPVVLTRFAGGNVFAIVRPATADGARLVLTESLSTSNGYKATANALGSNGTEYTDTEARVASLSRYWVGGPGEVVLGQAVPTTDESDVTFEACYIAPFGNVRRFVLKTDLSRCGSALCGTLGGESLTDLGTDYEFTIHDTLGILEYTIPSGSTGWARWMGDTEQWELVSYGTPCESSSSAPPSSGSPSSKSSDSSESSKSSSSKSSQSQSESSESQPPSESWSGSDKSSAIVPASWSPTGYVALFIHEMPEVRFDDVMVVNVPQENQDIKIDPHFVEVCERGSIEVCGIVPDKPILVGARAHGDKIRLQFAQEDSKHAVRLVIRLTGIRRGFAGKRFPRRTREQFLANEAFINSAYPSDPRAE